MRERVKGLESRKIEPQIELNSRFQWTPNAGLKCQQNQNLLHVLGIELIFLRDRRSYMARFENKRSKLVKGFVLRFYNELAGLN